MSVSEGAVLGGRYHLVSRIAKGGQAEVWEARQVPFQQRVALKILIPRSEELGRERLAQEAAVLAGLNHPNIVRVIDCGTLEDDSFFLAMEYIEGRRLKTILRQREHSPTALLCLVDQVCSALEAAHQIGVIHRDVKLSNVLVCAQPGVPEQAKVVDFGIARLMEGDPGLTSEGMVLGSPRFMAPELIRGESIDHRVDIYGVGVLLYCCMAGNYPFNGRNPHEIMRAHLRHRPPAFRMPGEVSDPQGLGAVLARALARERHERFETMSALRAALRPHLPVTPSDLPGGPMRRRVVRG